MIIDRLSALATSKPARIVVLLGLAVYGFTVLRGIVVHDKQWDFKTYYLAAKVASRGMDPYHTPNLSQAAGEIIRYPYVYPPVTLAVFRPLTLLPYSAAYKVFLAVKLGAIGLLIWMWLRLAPRGRGYGLLFALFCVLGFRETLIRDLNAGNISCFEQALIWGAVLFYLAGRPYAFSFLVAAAAVFKLNAAGLLALPLVGRDRSARPAVAAAGLTLAIVNGVSYLVQPDLFGGFLANASSLNDRGKVNPSSLALIRDAAAWVESVTGSHIPGAAYAIYAVFLAVLAAAAYLVLRRLVPRLKGRDKLMEFICFCFLLYALASPRFKDYSFMLLIVPSLHVVKRAVTGVFAKAIAVAGVCIYCFTYQPLVVAGALFAVYSTYLVRREALTPRGDGADSQRWDPSASEA